VHLADGVFENLLSGLVDVVLALLEVSWDAGKRLPPAGMISASPPEPSISPRKSMKPNWRRHRWSAQ